MSYYPTAAFRANRKVSPRKGVENATTAQCKNALQQAFMQLGGVKGLVEWGQANQTEFYKLWSKLIPAESVQTAADKVIEVRILSAEPTVSQVIEMTADSDSMQNHSLS